MKTVYIDVDDTLVFAAGDWQHLNHLPSVQIGSRTFYVNTALIEKIKDFKAREHTVVVWSAGGMHWAHSVVQTLQLIKWVDHCLSKPDWIFDDKDHSKWMPKTDYIKPPLPEQAFLPHISVADIRNSIYNHTYGSFTMDWNQIEDDLQQASYKRK